MSGETRGEIEVSKPSPLVFPARAEEVVEAVKAFDWFKRNVLTENDYIEIQGRPYVKKSGWLKYALATGLSLQLLEERVETRNGDLIYHITYHAIAPGGRYADAVGSASRPEIAHRRGIKPEEVYDHHIRALAQTRACNRAISNLVGGGELSAEELEVPAPEESAPERGGERPPSPVTGKTLLEEWREKQRRRRGSPKPPRSLEELDYRIGYHLPGYRELVDVEETSEGWLLRKRRYLDQATWEALNDVVRSLGGSWSEEEGAWRIPRGVTDDG